MAKHAARPPGKSGGHQGEVRWWGPYGPNPVIPAAEKSFGVRLSAARTPGGGTDQGVATVYQKHRSVRRRKSLYTL